MRVLAIVNSDIMVKVKDVRPNDILAITGTERDSIIERLEEHNGLIRFIYKQRSKYDIPFTVWMNPDSKVFIHDLNNEKKEFFECQRTIQKVVKLSDVSTQTDDRNFGAT